MFACKTPHPITSSFLTSASICRDLDMRPYLASAVLRRRFRLPPMNPRAAGAADGHGHTAQQQQQPGEDGAMPKRTRSGGLGGRRGSGGLPSPTQPLSPGLGGWRGSGGLPSPAQPLSSAAGSGEPAAAAAGAAAAAVGATPDPAACLYDLYAVVCHKGSFQASVEWEATGGICLRRQSWRLWPFASCFHSWCRHPCMLDAP